MPEKKGIDKLVRPDLLAFGGYSASTSPETLKGKVEVPVENIIKLDANENPYGFSTRVSRALSAYADFNIYPDDAQTGLRKLQWKRQDFASRFQLEADMCRQAPIGAGRRLLFSPRRFPSES